MEVKRLGLGKLEEGLYRTFHETIRALSVRPRAYYGVRAITGKMDELCIRRGTELVIEGYPRSANSTTVHRFLERQDRPVRVAHHKHHAAQLLRAAEWGIPAVALVREPRSAILSHLALREEVRRRLGRPARGWRVGFEEAASAWLAFYGAILPHRESLLIVTFERATGDLEGVIDDLNARFGTAFRSAPEILSPQPEFGWHALPNPVRHKIKGELEEAFEREIQGRPRLVAVIEHCEAVYQHLRAGA